MFFKNMTVQWNTNLSKKEIFSILFCSCKQDNLNQNYLLIQCENIASSKQANRLHEVFYKV